MRLVEICCIHTQLRRMWIFKDSKDGGKAKGSVILGRGGCSLSEEEIDTSTIGKGQK